MVLKKRENSKPTEWKASDEAGGGRWGGVLKGKGGPGGAGKTKGGLVTKTGVDSRGDHSRGGTK